MTEEDKFLSEFREDVFKIADKMNEIGISLSDKEGIVGFKKFIGALSISLAKSVGTMKENDIIDTLEELKTSCLAYKKAYEEMSDVEIQ